MSGEGWVSRRKSLPWQTMLTVEERAEIERIDAELLQIEPRRRELTSARRLIQNRAVQRYRYANPE